jgi:NADPH:quinone reductase-like Zn-dependent oxidoreductase
VKQLQFIAPGKPALVDVADPVVPEDGLLLRTRVSALSNGTERAQMLGLTYNKQRRFPAMPGYQAISEVVEVGAGVTRFAPGDIVYSGTFGTHAEWHAARQDALLAKLPADGDLEALAFLAVAAVSWNDVGLTGLQPGERLLVVGAGPIGQFAVQAGRLLGAEVSLASRGAARLAVAEQIGAVRTIQAEGTESDDLRAAGPFEVVAECSGADVLDGIIGVGFGSPKLLIPRGGRLVPVAGRDRIAYDGNAAQSGRVTIVHCTHFDQHHLDVVCDHFLAGRMQSRPLITRVEAACDIVGVYETLRDRQGDLFGTLFRWD